MSFTDFVENFDKIGICHLTPTTMSEEIFRVKNKILKTKN